MHHESEESRITNTVHSSSRFWLFDIMRPSTTMKHSQTRHWIAVLLLELLTDLGFKLGSLEVAAGIMESCRVRGLEHCGRTADL